KEEKAAPEQKKEDKKEKAESAEPAEEEEAEEGAEEKPASKDGQRIKASPLARKIAKEKGIDISQVKGSAEGGRIVKKDVEAYTPPKEEKPAAQDEAGARPAAPVVAGQESFDEVKVSQ